MCGRPGSGRSPNASGPQECPLWATRPTLACPRWSSARSKAGASRSGRRTSTPNTLSCAGPVNGRSPSSSSGASCAAYAAAPTAPARSLVPCSCFSSEKQDEKGSVLPVELIAYVRRDSIEITKMIGIFLHGLFAFFFRQGVPPGLDHVRRVIFPRIDLIGNQALVTVDGKLSTSEETHLGHAFQRVLAGAITQIGLELLGLLHQGSPVCSMLRAQFFPDLPQLLDRVHFRPWRDRTTHLEHQVVLGRLQLQRSHFCLAPPGLDGAAFVQVGVDVLRPQP